MSKTLFGTTKDGRQARLVTISNKNGMSAAITDYGAALVSLIAPDKFGKMADVVRGFDNVTGYENTSTYMGATIGRHAGQVANGTFFLNGKEYKLDINDHQHTMHGGPNGFHNQLFEIISVSEGEVVLSHLNKDGEAHFPGNLTVTVTYRLNDDNSLTIDYDGTCDTDTILSMTNHAYFNLDGLESDNILGHILKIYAREYTEVDDVGLPTGKIFDVEKTPYDFSDFHTIGERIGDPHQELQFCNGYDHNWVIQKGNEMVLCCELVSTDGNRHMQLISNQPGLQMYSGNYLTGEIGKAGKVNKFRCSLCLEPQVFPNGLNHAHFPSPVLKAGEVYRYRSEYRFL